MKNPDAAKHIYNNVNCYPYNDGYLLDRKPVFWGINSASTLFSKGAS